MIAISNWRGTLLPVAMLAMAAPAGAATEDGPAGHGEVMTTVFGQPPADLSGLVEGPVVQGIISARSGDRIRVTATDGTSTAVFLSEATEIRGGKGPLSGKGPDNARAALINGLPVTIRTARWGASLVATQVRFKSKDHKIASMIHNGTSQRFDEQAAATDALRSRMGDIDKYNIKTTTNVYFDTGKTALSARARSDLCVTASEAGSMENSVLLVLGYTDSVGNQDFNQLLSEKRASRVVNHLQQACGWKPYRMLTPTGMAEADPLADNSTAQGKAQNRRVSVNVLVSKAMDGF
jgi:OOP family OmpA-OmpF porin